MVLKEKSMRTKSNEFIRWSSKVNKTEDCWLWEGTTHRRYGAFRRFVDGKWTMFKAHRYAYEYFIGEIPPKMFVCHKCDNPKCVNPAHLWLGTAQENVTDKMQKGRHIVGLKTKGTNLNMEIAQQIRECFKTKNLKYPEIAKMFNTNTSQVCRIIKNQIWKAGTEN
jgi:hypothetical protein